MICDINYVIYPLLRRSFKLEEDFIKLFVGGVWSTVKLVDFRDDKMSFTWSSKFLLGIKRCPIIKEFFFHMGPSYMKCYGVMLSPTFPTSLTKNVTAGSRLSASLSLLVVRLDQALDSNLHDPFDKGAKQLRASLHLFELLSIFNCHETPLIWNLTIKDWWWWWLSS